MERICDFNIHIPANPVLDDDLHFSRLDNQQFHLDALRKDLKENCVASGNVMVMDTEYALTVDPAVLRSITDEGVSLTAVIDTREKQVFEQIDRLAGAGFQGIKIHPYGQNIADHDFYAALGAIHHAQTRGLWLVLCCSYGSAKVFENHGAKLLGAIAQARLSLPVIALHSGGGLAIEVMSIALESPNIILDTSFSIPYFVGSSVELDIAFAIRKVGVDRVLFGSDRPYQPLDDSINGARDFFTRHGFSDMEIETMMSSNFDRLHGRG